MSRLGKRFAANHSGRWLRPLPGYFIVLLFSSLYSFPAFYSDIDARLRPSTGYFYPMEPRYNKRKFAGQRNDISLTSVVIRNSRVLMSSRAC